MNRFIFFILLFFNTILSAQNCKYQLTGEVLDGETSEKLVGALVILTTLNQAIETDENGHYDFKNLCADSLEIRVTYEGYKPYKGIIKLRSDFHLDILLHSESCELASVEIVHQKEEFKTLNTVQISAQELDQQRGKSLGELLKTLPGVDAVQTGPNIYKPTIQGFSGNRIVMIQNQVRLEGQNWGNDHAPEIDPFSAEKITVIKGANALMYGPEAQAGAIVIAPYKAPKAHGVFGNVFSNYQTNNRMIQNAAQVSISSHKFHGWYLHLQGSQKYGGKVKTPVSYLDNTASRELNGSLHLGYEGPRKSIEFTYTTFNQKLGVYRGAHIGNLSDLIKNLEGNGYQNSNQFSYAINRSYQNAAHHLLQAHYRQSFRTGSSLQVLATYQNNARKEYDIHRPKNDLSTHPNISYALQTYQGELIYNHRLLKNVIRKSGIQAFIQNNITQTSDLRLFLPNFETKNLGVYHINTIVLRKTQLDLGLRYDLRNIQVYKYIQQRLMSPQKTYHALSASMGLAHNFDKQLSFAYNASYTTRPPAINELFSDGLHHGESIFILKNNTDFGFETENSLSNSANIRMNTLQTSTELSLFYNRIQNFIYLKPTDPVVSIRGVFPTFYYTQSNATVAGVDLRNRWDLSKRWKIDSKSSITRGKEQFGGDYILNMPQPQLGNTLTYKLGSYQKIQHNELALSYIFYFKQLFFPKNKFDITYNTVEGLKTFTINGDYLPAPKAFGLLNLTYSSELLLKKTKINFYFSCNNLLNVQYRNYLNRLRYYTDEQGINCSLTVKLSF